MYIPRVIPPRDIAENPQKVIKELNEAYLELHREVQKLRSMIEAHDKVING